MNEQQINNKILKIAGIVRRQDFPPPTPTKRD